MARKKSIKRKPLPRRALRDVPSKAERAASLLPIIREARAVVRARKRPGGLAEEARHMARLREEIHRAEHAGTHEDWNVPARRLSAAILKEAPTRQARLFNPGKGALVWDSFHKWTARVVECWTARDADGEWEVCTLERVGNPPAGSYSAGINVGDRYTCEARRVKIAPQRALGAGGKPPSKTNPRKPKAKQQVRTYMLSLR